MDAVEKTAMVPSMPRVAGTTRAIASSLNFQFGLAFLLLLTVAVLNGFAMHKLMDEQAGIADTIGVAGRLRMLSQRMAANTFLILTDPPGQYGKVAADIEEFESGLDAVERGGRAYGYLGKRLPGELDHELDTVRKRWTAYRDDLNSPLRAPFSPAVITPPLIRENHRLFGQRSDRQESVDT